MAQNIPWSRARARLHRSRTRSASRPNSRAASSYAGATTSWLARTDNRRGKRRAGQRRQLNIDEARGLEPSGSLVEAVIAAAGGQQQVEREDRSRRRFGEVAVHDVILDGDQSAPGQGAKAFRHQRFVHQFAFAVDNI